jgi:hypothetical protein
MIERRTLERIEINQPAMLHLDGIRGVYPCMVMNFHNQGAGLHCSTFHIVVFEFDLSFDGFKTIKHCHVVWRHRNYCGVEFVESHAKAIDPHSFRPSVVPKDNRKCTVRGVSGRNCESA